MGTLQEDNNLNKDISLAEELFGVFELTKPLEHDGTPDATVVKMLLENDDVRAIGFCEACGSTFGIIEAGMNRLQEEFNLSLGSRETEYVFLPTCATCKYRPEDGSLPTVKSF